MQASIITCFVFMAATAPAWAQFTSFSFKGAKGNEPVFSPDFQPEHALVSGMTRGTGVVPSTAPEGFGGAGWTKGSTPDPTQYFEFTIAPQEGFKLNLESLVITDDCLGTGAREYSVRSSLDGFSHDLAKFQSSTPTTTRTQGTVVLGNQFLSLGQAVTFRIFGYSSAPERFRVVAGWPVSARIPTAANGSWMIDSLVVNGSIPNPVPEPAQAGIAAALGVAGFALSRRRRA